MADLDEMSTNIGEIRADIRHMLKWFDQHEDRDQERFEKLGVRIDAANGYRGRIQTLEATVAEHKPVVEGLQRIKWLWGIVAALGAFAATLLVKWLA